MLLEGDAGQVGRLVLGARVDLEELLVGVGLRDGVEHVVEGEADAHDHGRLGPDGRVDVLRDGGGVLALVQLEGGAELLGGGLGALDAELQEAVGADRVGGDQDDRLGRSRLVPASDSLPPHAARLKRRRAAAAIVGVCLMGFPVPSCGDGAQRAYLHYSYRNKRVSLLTAGPIAWLLSRKYR